MAMAITMREYLKTHDVDFEEVAHPREVGASWVAQRSHVAGDQLAKAVLINGDSGYRVLLVPSTCRVNLGEVSHHYRERLGLATENEIHDLFADCEDGALPALAQAYGVRVCYDDTLVEQSDVYLEAGDHETLVRMSGREFHRLMAEADHGSFSRHF